MRCLDSTWFFVTGALTALWLAPTPAQSAPSPKTGLLRVTATPYAQVYVDGKAIGITPVAKHRLRVGSYKVELRTSKGQSWYKDITVRPGRTVTLAHRFPAARRGRPGTLHVTSVPWSQVFLDGKAVGSSPLVGYRLSSKSYNLELKTADGRIYKRILFVSAGRTARVWHRFPATSAPKDQGPAGWLRVNSAPASVVFVDGKRVGTTPLVDHDLPTGHHVVKLVAADKRTHQRQIHIGRDKTTQFVYRFPPKRVADQGPRYGKIRVAANVVAAVFIDGKSVGWTPLIDHQLRPGRHRVTVKYRKRRRSYRIHIRAGYTRAVTVRFRK